MEKVFNIIVKFNLKKPNILERDKTHYPPYPFK